MNLRRKLWLGFGGLLTIHITMGVIGVVMLTRHSRTMDKIFRENYDSVAAAEKMKDAISELDSAALQLTLDDATAARELSKTSIARFNAALDFQYTNITLPNERAMTDKLQETWSRYKKQYDELLAQSHVEARKSYLAALLPHSIDTRRSAQIIADANLNNMISVDGQVQQASRYANNAMNALLAIAVLFSIAYVSIFSASLVRPLEVLTRSAKDIENGNLDLVVNIQSRDEVGQLAEAFNSMTTSLRELRRGDRAKFLRVQQTTQHAINTLPDAVAVLSLQGVVELSNDAARQTFGIPPDSKIDSLSLPWLVNLHRSVCQTERSVEPQGYESVIQIFGHNNEERFFLPHALPMLDDARRLIGVIVILADVTQLRRLDEMKSGLVSTVSHELRTPLTSIRMAVHVLLDEKIGPLTPKQQELVTAARDDSERLHRIIEDLLDMSRIESGRANFGLTTVSPESLVNEAKESLRASYESKNVTLTIDVAENLPQLNVNKTRINQVFANLLGNALKYTPSGGSVTIRAKEIDKRVIFEIADTGTGIPEKYMGRIFEKFFRVPGQNFETGAGLGLAIAKDIVEAHHGTISVTSEEGRGTTFTVALNVQNS